MRVGLRASRISLELIPCFDKGMSGEKCKVPRFLTTKETRGSVCESKRSSIVCLQTGDCLLSCIRVLLQLE